MVNRHRTRQAPEHEVVVGNLLDLQARLRGDPASSVPADRTLVFQMPEAFPLIDEEPRAATDASVVHLPEPATDVDRLGALEARVERLESVVAAALERGDASPDR
jgi:hypothetical protein